MDSDNEPLSKFVNNEYSSYEYDQERAKREDKHLNRPLLLGTSSVEVYQNVENLNKLEININYMNVFIKVPRLISRLSFGFIDGKSEWLHILRDVKGVIKSGELVAILGSSGSGKTTLLNTLAGRMVNGRDGVKVVNRKNKPITKIYSSSLSGKLFSFEEVNSLIGYVMQQDYLLSNLTCYETLVYAGMLRLPKSLNKFEKLKVIERTLLELGLRDCANTRVGTTGGSGQRLSGGERRRLSIAIQLLTQPSNSILFPPFLLPSPSLFPLPSSSLPLPPFFSLFFLLSPLFLFPLLFHLSVDQKYS